MIITHLKGGLGNQMFQYACGYALAKDYNSSHKLDISYYSSIPSNNTQREFELSQFNISSAIAKDSELKNLRGKRNGITKFIDNISSKIYTIFTTIYPIEKYFGIRNLYLNGYFQSEKFFIKYRKDIIKEFTLRQDQQTEGYRKIANKIKNDKNAVSMHIRRGDYVTDTKTAKYHGVLGIKYYEKALKTLNTKKSYIYIFSDDINWVKKNFTFLPKNTYFVSKHKFNSAQEIILMSLCKYNIIANSSFSWWGAWLNQNKEKIVVAPSQWITHDIFIKQKTVPDSWIKI